MSAARIKGAAALVVLLAGCPMSTEDNRRMAVRWATQMGYEDAQVVCMGNYCSVRTKHAQNPIPIACYETGCQQRVR